MKKSENFRFKGFSSFYKWISLAAWLCVQSHLSYACADYYLSCGESIQGYTWDFPNRLGYSDYANCLNFNADFNASDVIVELYGRGGDVVRLEMGAGIDLDLFLFNNCPTSGGSFSGSGVTCIGSSFASSGPEEIVLPYDGFFFVVIDGWRPSEEGFYDLSLQCFSSECSDHSLICGERIQGYTWDYANRLTYSDYAGCLNFPYEFNARDVIVEVNGKAGDIIRLEMGSGIDLDLFLFNDCPQGGGGGSLTSSRTSCIGASTAASGPEEITLPYDGVFYAVIDGWNSAQEGYFDLTMYCSVDCFGIPELECGETVTHWTGCGPYPPNGGFYICTDEITHLECSPKEYTMYHKEYSFTASTSGTYTFTLSGLEDDTDLFLFYDYCGVTTYYLQCGEYSINQGTTSETIQVQLSAGQTVYLLVDGPEVSRFDLSVSCGPDPCRDCWNCFYFGRKSNDDRVFSLNSSYCFTGMPTEYQERIQNEARYEWSVAGSQVEYLENTNSTSQHPVMRFPGAGTYTVCMKIFQMNTNTLLYECCQRIIVRGTCTATPAAHFTYTYNASDQSFSLNAGTSVGGDHVLWDFYSEENNLPVTVLEGNKTSLTTKIVIPEFRCKDVCLSVSNGCGMSVYCVTLCRSNTNCQGNTPLYTLGGPVSPVINDRTLSFPTFPSAPAGTNVTFAWDFGDGGTSQARNPQYTYGAYGYYRVCLIIRVGCKKICYCWNIHVNPCPPVFEPHGGMLRVQFNGNENSLQYTIQSQNIQIASNQPWLVDNNAVNGSQGNSSLILALPQDRDYVICFPYLKNNGCLAYKCITVRGGNPFSCQNIVTRFTQNTGYQFSLPAGSSDISWTVDETGQSLGSDISSQYLPPVIPCTWRTISVRYFDGFRYRICCIRVFICLPDDCFTNIYYGDSGNQAHFRLEESGATDITWYFDDAPANILGSSNQVTLPYPGTCTTRWISVRFRDALGRWKICCRLVYFCNPFQCSSIRPVYSENNGYQFELDQNYSNIQWFVDETGQQLGNSVQSTYLPLPVAACGFRTISVRYRHPSGHWVLCCLRFWWCNPSVCQDQISVVKSGNNHVLSTSASYQQVSWYLGNQFLGSGNNFTASLPVNGSHKIYVRYFNPSNQSWYWCCSLYTPGGSGVCDVYNVLFREDFKSGPPAGYGYNQGERIDKNVTWWKGDGTVTGEAGWVTSGKNLALTFHKNTLGIPRVKVQFDMIIPWYRNLMNGTYSIGLNGGFSLNSDFQSYGYTLTNMVQNQPGLLQVCNGGADILYCTHKTEVIADKNGLVEVYIDGKKVNHVFTIPGNQVTNINFYGDITIDNVEIGECRLSNPFRDVIVDIQDQICGPANTEVLVPVSVRNYRNISGIQLKIASGDPSVAEITGFANINPNSGITPLDFAVVDKKLVLTYAFSPYSLNDDEKLFDIKVMLKSQSPAVVGLFFEGDLKALDVNGGSINVTGLGGSVCVSQANLSVAGRIATSKDKGIQNVTVTGGIQNVFTGANGLYQVPQLSVGSSYNIKPEFDEALASGVDISDLFVLRRHMQGLSLFNSPYTYMAADMNTDKVIDISDLFLLRRIMQGLTTQLPNGLKAWRFVPKSYSFPAGNPLSATIPESLAFNPLQQNQSNQDFVGVKFGDLDHSRISLTSDKTANRNNADVEFSFENRTAPSGTTIELALSCKNLSKAAVMQFSVQWPTDKLELIGLPSGNHIQIPGTTLFDETVRSSGKLGIIWETDNFATGTTLADGTVIYTFTFRLIGQNNSTAIVENSVEPKTAKLLTVDGAEVPLKVNAGTVQIALTSATEKTEERPLIIRPNPTNGRVFLDTSLTGIHKATIYSMTGQEHTVTVDPQGIDLSAFPAGVYLIQIHFEGKLYIGRVVKI